MNQDLSPYGLPNFLVIGAARSGTTTLYEYLKRHPDIYVPESKRPEPHYFLKSEEYAKGLEYYKNRYFNSYGNEKRIGEISTSYLYSEKAAQRIWKYNTDIQLIAILRNPIDRAYSNYWHTVKNGFESESFEFAIRNEQIRNISLSDAMKEIAPFAYLARSKYDQQLSNYFKLFHQSQIHLSFFEDFVENTGGELRKIFDFLDVDNIELSIPQIINNNSTPDQNEMANETREYLRDYFTPSINALEHLIGRDLSKWKE